MVSSNVQFTTDNLIFCICNIVIIASTISNTVCIGWSLGEHAEWAKYSNYDVALRVPLIISIPGVTFTKSKEKTNLKKLSQKSDPSNLYENDVIIDSLVELVDIFPTIADLANISIPICSNENTHTQATCSEGISLLPLMKASLKGQVYLKFII